MTSRRNFKFIKKVSLLIATTSIALSIVPFNIYATNETQENVIFIDMPNDWSTEALQEAVNNKLLKGLNIDGKMYINADKYLTRAELATIIVRAFGSTHKADLSKFNDINEKDWFYEDMAKAVAMGIINGSDNKINPNDFITREQAFTIVSRAFVLYEGFDIVLTEFSDTNEISEWAKEGIKALATEGCFSQDNGKIRPKDNITRKEFAFLMYELVEKYNQDGKLSSTYDGNVVINEYIAPLENTSIMGDLIITDGVKADNVVINNVEVNGRIVIRGDINTVTINNSSCYGGIYVNNNVSKTRVTSNHLSAQKIDILSDAIVEGQFLLLNVYNSSNLELENANVNNIVIESGSDNSSIIINDSAVVEFSDINSPGVNISGKGILNNAIVNSKNVTITTKNTCIFPSSEE